MWNFKSMIKYASLKVVKSALLQEWSNGEFLMVIKCDLLKEWSNVHF